MDEQNNSQQTEPVTQAPAPQEPAKAPEQKKGLTTNQKIMIGGFALLACVIVGGIVYLGSLNQPQEIVDNTTPGGNYLINEDNLARIGEEMQDKVEKGMFETYMNTTWRFPNGTSPSENAVIGNSESNHYPFYFTITLASGEVVYTSDLIPVGAQLKQLVLDTPLDAGTYPATCTYHLVNEEEGGEEGGDIGFSVTLEIRA